MNFNFFFLLHCSKAAKEILKTSTIISTENQTDARVYGTICARHKTGNNGEVCEATRLPCYVVRCKKGQNPADTERKPAYCKAHHDSNGHLQHISFPFRALLSSVDRWLAWSLLRLELYSDDGVEHGYQHQWGMEKCKNYRYHVNVVGDSKDFIPLPRTRQLSWIFSKFEREEKWGVDSHRDDPSGENKDTAML